VEGTRHGGENGSVNRNKPPTRQGKSQPRRPLGSGGVSIKSRSMDEAPGKKNGKGENKKREIFQSKNT